MILQIQLFVVVGLTLSPVLPLAARERPTGCRASETTADLLRILAARDWSQWTREDLSNTWPGFLHLNECEPKDDECGQFVTCHCDRLIAEDRVIEGNCECCDLFYFRVDMEADRVRSERLETVILHHAVSTRELAEVDAKQFLQAIGFDESTPGHKRFGDAQSVDGHYEWPTGTKGVINSVNLSLGEVSEGWKIFLYWTEPEIPAN